MACGAGPSRPTRVLYLPVDADAEAGRALTDELADREDLSVEGLPRLAALAARVDAEPDREVDADAAVERHLREARAAFSRFEHETATTHLTEAINLLRDSVATPAGRRRLSAAHLELALVNLVHGEREAAGAELRACLNLDADCAPDPARYPPEMIELHTSVRESAGAAGGTLVIATEPPGATATLDGGRESDTPASFDDVASGRHYVLVSRDGYRSEVQTVQVAPGETTRREVVLRPGPPQVRAAAALRALQRDGSGADPRWRAEAAELARVDAVLVTHAADGGRMTFGAFDANGQPRADGASLLLSDGDGARAWLDDALPAPETPFYGQWWFWTPVAAVIAGAVATSVFLATRERDVALVGGETIRE